MEKIKTTHSQILMFSKDPNKRIGQLLVQSNFKPASLMLNDELRYRSDLFYISNEEFFSNKNNWVEITE